jgi:site-specific DNA-methyltransferase (adenine-specific)
MKPYYEEKGITIYHGDCREILPTLSPVDLVLTDPPFAVRKDKWDVFKDAEDFKSFTSTWLKASYACSPLIVCFFADKLVPLLLEAAAQASVPYRRALIWRKPPGSQFAGASLDGFWFDFEMIQVFGEPRVKTNKATRFGVLEFRTVIGQTHGCEKPEGLLRVLVDAYAPLGGMVVDPFMGTGTSLRAAKDMGRLAIGIDLGEQNCEIAAKRLQQGVLPLTA